MFCRQCGNPIGTEADFCIQCGFRPMKSSNFCQSCGEVTLDKQEMCMHCGNMLITITAQTYAGFWHRFSAFIIDSVIITIPIFIVGFSIGFLAEMSFITGAYDYNDRIALFVDIAYVLNLFIAILIYLLYFAISHSSSWQASIGKKLVGLKVIDYNGQRISFWRSLGRTVATYLSGILYIGYIIAGLTKKKQALHDFIAKTYVIKT